MKAIFWLFVAGCSSSAAGASHDAGHVEDTGHDASPSVHDSGRVMGHAEAGAQTDAAKVEAAVDAHTGDAPAADTWSNYAEAFVTKYCVECHGPSDPVGNDFTLYAKVAADRDVMRCGVAVMQVASWGCSASPAAEQFPISDGKTPPNPKPTDAERDRFVAWLSAGAPQ